MNKGIFAVTILVFSYFIITNIVCANGLIVTPTTININKTIGISKTIDFNILNSESFTLYNLTSSNNTIITFPIIAQLASGQSINVTATVNYDTVFNGNINILGFYPSPIGQSAKNYSIVINTDFTLSPCSISMVMGDSVVWRNNNQQTIKIREGLPSSGQVIEGGILAYNQTLYKTFPLSREFIYYITLDSWPPTSQVCTLIINNDTGLIHDKNLDGILNLALSVNYLPTQLSASFIETNYTMDFLNTNDGIVSIKNTGSNTAKNIHLSGDWMSFSSNDFDLAINNTKVITYKISPTITNTAETNKTYNKNILISGNFPTINQTIKVFINYANIETFLNGTGNIQDTLMLFCQLHPKSQFCDPDPQIVYKYLDNSTLGTYNVTMTNEQFNDMWVRIIKGDNAREVLDNYIKQILSQNSEYQNYTTQKINSLEAMFSSNTEDQKSTSQGVMVFLIIIFVVASIIIVLVLIFVYKRKRDKETLRRY